LTNVDPTITPLQPLFATFFASSGLLIPNPEQTGVFVSFLILLTKFAISVSLADFTPVTPLTLT